MFSAPFGAIPSIPLTSSNSFIPSTAHVPTASANVALAHHTDAAIAAIARLVPLAHGAGVEIALGPVAAWAVVILGLACWGLALLALSSALCRAARSSPGLAAMWVPGPLSSPLAHRRAGLAAIPVTRRDPAQSRALPGAPASATQPTTGAADPTLASLSVTPSAVTPTSGRASATGTAADRSAAWQALTGGQAGKPHDEGDARLLRVFAARPDVVCRLAFQRWCYQHGRLSEFTAAAPHAPPTDGMVTGKS